MAFIETVSPEGAEGLLAKIYDAARQRAGKVYRILQVQSLRIETLRAWIGLYRAVMFAPTGLSRVERELVATVVSRTNGCHY